MNIINCHIPKTGTKSIQALFENSVRRGRHIGKLNADIPNDSLSFTIIRDPLARFKSCVRMFLRLENCLLDKDQIIDIALNHTFTMNQLSRGIHWHNVNESIAVHSLSMFHPFLNVFDSQKVPKAKYLIDFNNFANELAIAFPHPYWKNIPHKNQGVKESIELDPQQLKKFNHKYQSDILFYEEFIREKDNRTFLQ